MKKIILSGITILISALTCAETTKEVPTEIKSVTIYQQGAIIMREGNILIPKGKSTLIMQGLPAKLTPSRKPHTCLTTKYMNLKMSYLMSQNNF